MCHMVYISTSSDEDLAKIGSRYFSIRAVDPDEGPDVDEALEYPSRWYISGRWGGCSCHLRYFPDALGFHDGLDWWPEEPNAVEDTAAIYDMLQRLVAEGNKVDVVDLWNDEAYDGFESITVSLSEVTREKFLFMENRRLNLTP